MQLIAAVKLLPTPEQADALRRTLQTANAAANAISRTAWQTRTFGQYALQRLTYHPTRAASPLSAQVVVRVIAKVADAYKLDRERRRRFGPLGSLAFDARILGYHLARSEVSIWTVDGRQRIPFVCGQRQRDLLAAQQGESDLVCRHGRWYLYATVNVVEPPAAPVQDYLGVDLGIVNLAADSDGATYSGEAIDQQRRTCAHRRRNLQRKGTRAAKRKLRALRGRQARFQTDTNHVISQRLVATAQGTGRGLAVEDLGGIRDRLTVRRRQRARHANWSFAQLRAFIAYKAQRAGVPVVAVDPRNTSRTCPACGYVDPANRRTQAQFSCVRCRLAGPADTIAARNIASRARAVVMQPNGGGAPAKVAERGQRVQAPAASRPL